MTRKLGKQTYLNNQSVNDAVGEAFRLPLPRGT